MGPGDLLPPELSKYFGIDPFYLAIVVLFFGFITIRITQKYGILSRNIKSLDEVFLITIIGLCILFRLYWFYRMWIPAFTTTQLFLSFWFVPLLSIFVTLVILLASIYDAEIVFNKRIFSRKSKTTLTYRIFKRGKPKITSNEIDRNIQLTRFKTLIFGAIFINRQGKRLLAMHNTTSDRIIE